MNNEKINAIVEADTLERRLQAIEFRQSRIMTALELLMNWLRRQQSDDVTRTMSSVIHEKEI